MSKEELLEELREASEYEDDFSIRDILKFVVTGVLALVFAIGIIAFWRGYF